MGGPFLLIVLYLGVDHVLNGGGFSGVFILAGLYWLLSKTI